MYNNVYVGGKTIDQWGTFKRNKRDIKQEFKYNGNDFILVKILDGFYNKALIYQNKKYSGHYVLISYNTTVAEIIDDKFIIYGYYSITTANHINAFLRNFGLISLSKKEILTIENIWQENKNYVMEG